MSFHKIKSYAKINLALNIVGKTSSLHRIESIVAFINLYDEIKLKKINSNKHKISFVGKFSKNISKNNTISKLLEVLEKKKLIKNKKFEIIIKKKIPTKAGLGGGSMNAASLLSFFYRKKIIKISKKGLEKISKKIGSDVVLGLDLRNCILTSNNKVRIFKKVKEYFVLVVKPNFGCSTKLIYSNVRKFNKPKLNKPNKGMFDKSFLKKMDNSLEKIVFSKHSSLKKIKNFLETSTKSSFVRMTGSGSSLVAYFQLKKECYNAKKLFNKRYKNFWCEASKTI